MKIKVLALLLSASVFSYGQNQLMWERHVSAHYGKVTTDSENKIYTYGSYSESFDADPGSAELYLDDLANTNCFIQKFDESGDLIWTKTLHAQNVEIVALVTDASDNLYLTGHFFNTVDFDPGPDEVFLTASLQDIFVLKLTSAGDFIWAKSFGAGSHDMVNCVETDAENNVFVAGFFRDSLVAYSTTDTFLVQTSAITDSDAFLLKMDAAGNAKWIYSFGSASGSSEVIISVATDDDLNVYATGQFMWTVDFDAGPGETIHTSVAGTDACSIKLDSTGALVWCQVIHANGGGAGTYVKVDDMNDVLFCGDFRDTVDFDLGTGAYYLESEAYLAGHSNDYYIQKLDSDGNFIWARRIGNYTDEYAEFVVDTDSEESLFIIGNFRDSIDLDPGIGLDVFHVYDTSEILPADGYIIKLDKYGNYVWGGTIGGPHYDGFISVQVDNADRVVASLAGQWYFDVDPTTDSLILDPPSPEYFYGCMIKLERSILFNTVSEEPVFDNVLLYPNPTTGTIFITSSIAETGSEITIRNSLGEVVQHYQEQAFPISLELEGQTGFYFIEVITSQGIQTFKVIKTN